MPRPRRPLAVRCDPLVPPLPPREFRFRVLDVPVESLGIHGFPPHASRHCVHGLSIYGLHLCHEPLQSSLQCVRPGDESMHDHTRGTCEKESLAG